VKLFKRQLSVSLEDMENTMEEFKQFDEKYIDKECLKNYQSALNKLRDLEKFENALVTFFKKNCFGGSNFFLFFKTEFSKN
jgi:hypothetical protein